MIKLQYDKRITSCKLTHKLLMFMSWAVKNRIHSDVVQEIMKRCDTSFCYSKLRTLRVVNGCVFDRLNHYGIIRLNQQMFRINTFDQLISVEGMKVQTENRLEFVKDSSDVKIHPVFIKDGLCMEINSKRLRRITTALDCCNIDSVEKWVLVKTSTQVNLFLSE